VVGSGDFNGDGDSDILWQNRMSGQVSIWEMDGNTRIGGGCGRQRSGAGLESDRNRRFLRPWSFRHPFPERERRPGLNLGDGREHPDRRRRGHSHPRAERASSNAADVGSDAAGAGAASPSDLVSGAAPFKLETAFDLEGLLRPSRIVCNCDHTAGAGVGGHLSGQLVPRSSRYLEV
jgi:hypothetical protein